MNAALPLSPKIAEAAGYRPTKIDGYEIKDVVGRGGMGIVYRATHLSLGRETAIKLIRNAELADPKELRRFHYEAEMAAALQHPNIVQLFQYGEQDGRPYLAFEFVEGGSLDKKINGRPQPPMPTARLVETLARAVHAAHLRGIVHQDLKPANVLLMRDGTPKIADFGLARRLENSAQGQSEVIVGTACYMSPEQAWGDGQAQRVGPPTDVYALGAILYELMTGRPPFQASSSRETLEQVWNRNPDPPRQLVPAIPRDLETICLRCLQKDPSRRYPSAEALADDLKRYVEQMPIKARPVGDFERAWLWSRRNPANASLIAAVVLVAAVGFGSTVLFALDASAKAVAALEAKGKADEATKKANTANAATQLANEEILKQQYPLLIVTADREIMQGRLADAKKYLDKCRPQDRRLEWHLCRRVAVGTERQVTVGTGKVNWLTASPDGKSLLANLSQTGTSSLHHFSAESLNLLTKLPAAAKKASVSPEGKYVAVGILNELQIYRAADGKLLHKIPGAISCAFAPRGQFLAVGSGKEVNIYQLGKNDEVPELQSIHLLEELPWPAAAVAFGKDENQLFVLLAEPFRSELFAPVDLLKGLQRPSPTCKWQILSWDRANRQTRYLASGELPFTWEYLAASRDGSMLVAGSSEASGVYSWKAFRVQKNADGTEEAIPQEGDPFAGLYKTPCLALALSPDGQRLAHANYQGVITVIDTTGKSASQTLQSDQLQVESLAFLNGDKLLSGGTDGSVKVWDLAGSISGRRRLEGENTFGMHPKEPLLATTGKHGEIRIWDLRTLQRLRTLPAQPAGADMTPLEIDDLKFTSGGEELSAIYRDHTVRTWNVAAEKIVKTLSLEPYDPVKSGVATTLRKPWEPAPGTIDVSRFGGLQTELKQGARYCLSPDGSTLARRTFWYHELPRAGIFSLGISRAISPTRFRIDAWDLESGKHKYEVSGEAPVGHFADLQFSANGHELEMSHSQAFVQDSGLLRKFSAATGKETFPLTKVDRNATRVLSPDGSRAVELRNSQNELLLVDTRSDTVLIKAWHKTSYFLAAFTPDGQRVLAWNSEGIDILDGSPIEGLQAPQIPPVTPAAAAP